MTYLNAVKYVTSAPDGGAGKKSIVCELAEALGYSLRRIKYIRLAGSNGKTVCAEMLIGVLQAAGYTVGCLRMPLRREPRENICIGNDCLGAEEFSSYTEAVRAALGSENVSGNYSPPTRAELLLTVALLAFSRHKCDICIIESDHFGSDPSLVLPPPFAAVICGAIPSNDSAEISKIRSYICKGIRELISAPQNNEAYKIISETCYSVNCRLTLPSRTAIEIRRLSLSGTDFKYKQKCYSLRLCGRFQVSNAVLVLEVLEMLKRMGYKLSDEAVRKGLSELRLPAKFEVISLLPLIIVDSTHTPVAIETVCDALAEFKPAERSTVKIKLCLPSSELAEHYTSALKKRNYTVENVFLPPEPTYEGTCENTVCRTAAKALVKNALQGLQGSDILLISGSYSFVNPVRYELLNILGF